MTDNGWKMIQMPPEDPVSHGFCHRCIPMHIAHPLVLAPAVCGKTARTVEDSDKPRCEECASAKCCPECGWNGVPSAN